MTTTIISGVDFPTVACQCGECVEEQNFYQCGECRRIVPACYGSDDEYYDFCDYCACVFMSIDDIIADLPEHIKIIAELNLKSTQNVSTS